ncbi:MAG TPA: hypothetical protein VIA61_03615 [Methylomirabilota bacterium]|jgi:hypothetical protein
MTIDPRRRASARPGRDPRNPGPDICAEAIQQVLRRHRDDLRALILTGSLARGEGTVTVDREHCRVLGDAEFLAVFADGARRPPSSAMRATAAEIQAALRERRISCPVTLSAVTEDYLRALRPAIFAYELRSCGSVVWGDPTVLQLIPELSARDVPREDAWRLLCNRLIEQVEVTISPADGDALASSEARYRLVKLHLDMATSLLVFTDGYEPTYRGRSDRLGALARQPELAAEHPFPLESFARSVEACTRWKLDSSGSNPPPLSLATALDQAHRLWRWELGRLTGLPDDLTDQALLDALSAHQPAADRLRGWLYVVRRCGWHRSWRLWPRWARLARRGSPRYLIYSAACQALFASPRAVSSAAQAAVASVATAELPVVRPSGGAVARPWAEMVADVAFNYREFLVDTRA